MRLPEDVHEWCALVFLVVILAIGAFIAFIVWDRFNRPEEPPCKRYEMRSTLFPHRVGQITIMTPINSEVCVER